MALAAVRHLAQKLSHLLVARIDTAFSTEGVVIQMMIAQQFQFYFAAGALLCREP